MIADATMRHIRQAVNQIVHQADNPFYVKAWTRNIISLLKLEIELEKAQEPARGKGRKKTDRKLDGLVTLMAG